MRLQNRQRTLALAGALLALAFVQFTPRQAWACSAGGASGFNVAAQNSGSALTVCAKSVLPTRSVTQTNSSTPKPAPKPVPKPAPVQVAKPKPTVTAKPAPSPTSSVSLITSIKVGVPVALQKPVIKTPSKTVTPVVQKPPVSIVKTTTPVVQSGTSTSLGAVTFSPTPLSISASSSSVSSGDLVAFSTNAITHYKTALLLGKSTEVRFVPTQWNWSFGDGSTIGTAGATHNFFGTGSEMVRASVSYSVSYQVAGTTAWVDSGTISVADQIAITVAAQPAAPGFNPRTPISQVYLVGQTCSQKPSGLGCVP
jgi:hypothetical protein